MGGRSVVVDVQRLTPTAKPPVFATALAAGADLHADMSYLLLKGDRVLISTGIAIAVPVGFEAQVRPRSGLALKHGITVLNAPGTIDADYRGEIGVILYNAGGKDFMINKGDRIAQLVIARVETPEFQIVGRLDETERGIGGYGSTGVK